MRERRALVVALATVFGVGIGIVAAGVPGAIAGGLVGLVTGVAIGITGVRPLVAASVAAGTVIGFIVGRSIVSVLCAPTGCAAVEWIAGLATAAGAFVGVGLVVALATRSFEEYHEAVAAQRPPPEPGCEADEPPEAP